jgi:hypothetical protein
MKFPIVFFRLIPWLQILVTGAILGYFLIKTTESSATTAFAPARLGKILLEQSSSSSGIRAIPKCLAGADNFNPGLKLPARKEYIQLPSLPSPEATSGSVESIGTKSTNTGNNTTGAPFAVLEGIQPNINNSWNNSGQVNRTSESTAIFRLNNGDRLFFTTGYDTYEQIEAKTVVNIPVGIDWETKINSLKVHPGVGIDILNGSSTPNFNLKVDYPVTSGLTVSADMQQGAYKFNAKTIENKISALRYGPSIFWQIDKNISLFSSLKLGNYSDRNQEQQSFSRIEQKFGEFSVAGNLFTWNYKNPTDKGYFAPPDFLVYTGEVAWEGSVIRDVLSCRLAASLGGQNVNSTSSDAGGYQTKCTAKISPNIEADLGYSFSNIKNHDSGNSQATSQSISSQIRIKF